MTTNTNPATRWFEWSGKDGKLKWYDKETKTTHYVELPFRFLVLDQLNTVTGYSEDHQSGYYANEVRRLADPMTVKAAKMTIAKGRWPEDLKSLTGAKFTKSVYIAFKGDDGDLVLGNIKFSGAALGGLTEQTIKKGKYDDEYLWHVGWFNFTKKNWVEDGAVEIAEAVADSRGATTFYRPVFKKVPTTDETNAKALDLDRMLQAYLADYFKAPQEDDHPVEHAVAASAFPSHSGEPDFPYRTEVPEPPDDLDDIPF